MKTLHQLIAATILVLSLALFTYADDGHIPCPGVTAPTATVTGDIQYPVAQIAESLLASALSLS